MTGSCLRAYSRPPDAAVHLVCFPHAGGAATAYREWATLLPPSVRLTAIQYAGRQDRLGDPFPESMDELADAIGKELAAEPLPLLLFGHSFGAAVAFEVARRVEPVRHLVVSGRPGPQAQVRTTKHRWSDDDLWADMLRLGGTDAELARAPALRDLVLPAIRNDYLVIENYWPPASAVVSCPVTAFVGAGDPEVSRDQAAAWQRSTTGRFGLRVFDGAHFYLAERPARVVAELISLPH